MLIKCNNLKGILAAVLSVAGSFSLAQTYNITPGNTFIGIAPFNTPSHFNILQNNLTSGSLVFSWEQISINIPQGWTANLCDNGHCYTGFPVSGTMDTVFNGDYGLMSVAINPDTIAGYATIKYVVWEANSPSQKDTLTWIISANGFTGFYSPLVENVFSVYPNPANEKLNILSNFNEKFSVSIFNSLGDKIYSDHELDYYKLPVTNWKNGIYFISFFDKNNFIKTQKIIIQH